MDDSFPIDQELIVATRHLPTKKIERFSKDRGFLMAVACKQLIKKAANDIIKHRPPDLVRWTRPLKEMDYAKRSRFARTDFAG
jgi:hypothetical protein